MSIANLFTNNLKSFLDLKVNQVDCESKAVVNSIESSETISVSLNNMLEFQKDLTYAIDFASTSSVAITTPCGVVTISNFTNPVLPDGTESISLTGSADLIGSSFTNLQLSAGNGAGTPATNNSIIPTIVSIFDGAINIRLRNIATANYTEGSYEFIFFLY